MNLNVKDVGRDRQRGISFYFWFSSSDIIVCFNFSQLRRLPSSDLVCLPPQTLGINTGGQIEMETETRSLRPVTQRYKLFSVRVQADICANLEETFSRCSRVIVFTRLQQMCRQPSTCSETIYTTLFGDQFWLTGSDSLGCLWSPRVVLDNADGDLVLLSWSEAWLEKLVLRGWEGAQDFSVFFLL